MGELERKGPIECDSLCRQAERKEYCMDRCEFTPLLAFLEMVPDPRKARGKVFPWGFCGPLRAELF